MMRSLGPTCTGGVGSGRAVKPAAASMSLDQVMPRLLESSVHDTNASVPRSNTDMTRLTGSRSSEGKPSAGATSPSVGFCLDKRYTSGFEPSVSKSSSADSPLAM